jgi:hypothetical protein
MLGMEITTQRGVTRSRAAVNRLRQFPAYTTVALRATAFWLAVVLPAVYLPLLALETTWSVSLLAVLLGVHILTVPAGFDYGPAH